jgi:hypothetical protein
MYKEKRQHISLTKGNLQRKIAREEKDNRTIKQTESN